MGKRTDALGGSAVYGALAASYFTSVSMVGVVGTDFPPEHIELFEKKHINLEGMEILPGKTFRWHGVYHGFNQAETICTDLNVFDAFDPRLPQSCLSCKSLLLGNIHPQLQLNALDQIRQYRFVACDTMNLWINNTREQLMEVISRVDIVFINEDEVKLISGKSNVFTATDDLLTLGVRYVIVKRGEYGAIAISKDSMFFVPAYPVREVMDTTGAGDAFAGGFMGYLANISILDAESIKTAMRFGTVMAAVNVSSFSVEALAKIDTETIEHKYKELIGWT
ncbi:MAG: sugar kinase [Candidatus Cloacimonetes bacterium]|nr:sugar kinase [Candidatus Cloacimonadota bacterium]